MYPSQIKHIRMSYILTRTYTYEQDTPEDVARKINNAYCPSKSEDSEADNTQASAEAIDAGVCVCVY